MEQRTIIVTLSDKSFNYEVLENVQPVLVHFRANWSRSSDIMTPIIEELALEFSSEVAFGQIDSDKYGQIAMKFGIESIPILLFFNHGRVVDQTNRGGFKKRVSRQPKGVITTITFNQPKRRTPK